jgi:hypothetical protein
VTDFDELQVDAFLADSVVVSENKLYAQGAGWDTVFAASFPTRHPRVGLGAIVRVPWSATNQIHAFKVTIVDQDGQPLRIATVGEGEEAKEVREIGGQFTMGRPPMLNIGESQMIPIAINLDALEFERPDTYSVEISIDGTVVRRLPLRLRLASQVLGVAPAPAA